MTPEQILQHADRCVKCGLCLAVCPTYRLRADEGESPRGRIALIQGLVEQRLPQSPKLAGHLDRCLVCRACESACPSGVAYGRLIEAGVVYRRAHDSRLRRGFRRLLLDTASARRPLGVIAALLRLYQRSGLRRLVRHSRLLRLLRLERYDRLLPTLQAPFRPPAMPSPPHREGRRVALFTGCVSQQLEARALNAALELLHRLEIEVAIPPGQSCCGALHLHAGEWGCAQHRARHNLAEFSHACVDAIIGVDSGCMAQLLEYPSLLADDLRPETRPFAAKIRDISQYLLECPWPGGLRLRPFPARVAIHDPCSLRNVLQQRQAPYRLLSRIPQIDLYPLPDNGTCCGAAGSYLLTQPELSEQLAALKMEAITASRPDLLVTSNVGCALQLSAGIRGAGLDLEVLHPVELLARQLVAE